MRLQSVMSMFAKPGLQESGRQSAPGAPMRAAPVTAGSGPLFDPMQVLLAMWSLRWLVIGLTLLGIAAGVLIALASPHKYTAVTEILLDPRDIKLVQNEVTPNGLPSDATLALIQSQISVIYSNTVLQRVIDKADLANDPDFSGKSDGLLSKLLAPFAGKEDPATVRRRQLMTLAALREALNVNRDAKSFVINLAVTTRDADKSAEIANLVADSFIDQLAKVQSDTAKRASDALSSRLTELRQRVVEAERAVETYKRENRLVGVGGRLVDDDYIVRINDQLAKARGETTALRVRAEQMRKASVDDVVKGTLPEELTSDSLARLRDSYSDLSQRVATLAATLGPRHPRLIAARDALDSVRDGIRRELERIVSSAQTELARAEQTDRELTAQVNDLKDKQLTTSASFVRLRELEREVDASRAVYEAFLLRARETGEQEQMSTANVHVISSATPPLDPSSTSRKLIVIASAIAGFVAGIGLAGAIALIKVLRRSLRQTRSPVRWEPEAEIVPAIEARELRPRAASRADDLAAEVRPTVHVPPERVTRRESARGARDPMAGRVAEAEAAFAAHLPPAPAAVIAAPDLTRREAITSLPPRSKSEREALREKLRTIAEEAHLDEQDGDEAAYAIYNEDIARLQNDILAVKRNLADARSRRNTGVAPA
ncbi:chain-length determining protein [Jiella endophytica]|uniref:Chain-length determining protein n=2 Tax=Jiella endophytica TaxID=2558362 RepID=A0A4Y8RHT3_9HYPH|nr:chain-length determining protein [Jiella endophytica]